MDRRTFIVGGVAIAVPFAAEAQAAHRIGVLWLSPRDVGFDPFIQGLRELGYIGGRNWW